VGEHIIALESFGEPRRASESLGEPRRALKPFQRALEEGRGEHGEATLGVSGVPLYHRRTQKSVRERGRA
jgi:hypothetical protein